MGKERAGSLLELKVPIRKPTKHLAGDTSGRGRRRELSLKKDSVLAEKTEREHDWKGEGDFSPE